MLTLARSNLTLRKMRTALSVAAVAFEVAFVLILVGMTTGTLGDFGRRIENLESDILLLPPGGQLILSISQAVMPMDAIDKLLSDVPGVKAATPVVFANTNHFGSYSMIFGIDPATYNRAGRGLKLVSGSLFASGDDLVVDARLARAQGLKIGTEVELLNHKFRVSGICEEGAGVRMYLPLATVQDLLGRKDKASAYFIRASTPEAVESVVGALKNHVALQSYRVIPSHEYTDLLGTSALGLKEFVGAVTFVAVFFGFLVISLSLYTTISERTRQIGILKSLGAGSAFIIRSVVVECLILCVLGVAAGYGLTEVVKRVLQALHPTLIIDVSRAWMGRAALLALISGLLGALYPAWRAASIDPVKALEYE